MKTESSKYLLWLVISFLIAGAIEGYLGFESSATRGLGIAHTLIIAILVWAWCKMHAIENKLENISGFPAFAAFFPPLGVPTYFVKFFGIKNGARKILKAVWFTCILIIAYLVTGIGFEQISL